MRGLGLLLIVGLLAAQAPVPPGKPADAPEEGQPSLPVEVLLGEVLIPPGLLGWPAVLPIASLAPDQSGNWKPRLPWFVSSPEQEDDETPISEFDRALMHDDLRVRRRALIAVSRLDDKGQELVPALYHLAEIINAERDKDTASIRLLASALSRFKLTEQLDPLVKAARDENQSQDRRLASIKAIGALGRSTVITAEQRTALVGVLERLLTDKKHRDVPSAAAESLDLIDVPGKTPVKPKTPDKSDPPIPPEVTEKSATLLLLLRPEAMTKSAVTRRMVVDAIRDAFPMVKLTFQGENTIRCVGTVSDLGRIGSKLKVKNARGEDVALKDVADRKVP